MAGYDQTSRRLLRPYVPERGEVFVLPQSVRNPIGHPANSGGSNTAAVTFVWDDLVSKDSHVHEAQNAKIGEPNEACEGIFGIREALSLVLTSQPNRIPSNGKLVIPR